ncbi:hypothetical protein RchiOBHm_Chr2g0146721 [Rosa chinensis]|uniref:Translation initiation factor eIF2B subunit beta n=1 Tax=Rosa chinensis TaxID=74649 RepID=A0A2P6RZ07_ROSCH|nr:hypothetical protein RchiOBHm_Chr2g0146721 [Rosa chinensis]
MISQVIMVIVGARAVMANGGVIAPVGLNMVALAAQRHAVPFDVLAGGYKNARMGIVGFSNRVGLSRIELRVTPSVGSLFSWISLLTLSLSKLSVCLTVVPSVSTQPCSLAE